MIDINISGHAIIIIFFLLTTHSDLPNATSSKNAEYRLHFDFDIEIRKPFLVEVVKFRSLLMPSLGNRLQPGEFDKPGFSE